MANTPVELKPTTPTPPAADTWRTFRGEMDRLFDRFAAGISVPSFDRMFDVAPAFRTELNVPSPAVDITEDATGFKVTAELPGMAENDVEVALTDDVLTIKGEKTAETEKQDKNTYLSERRYGAFQRSFVVPDGVDRENITADFANGVLTLTLPKVAPAQKKTIEVEDSGVNLFIRRNSFLPIFPSGWDRWQGESRHGHPPLRPRAAALRLFCFVDQRPENQPAAGTGPASGSVAELSAA